MRLIISPASEAARLCREARPSHLLRLLPPETAGEPPPFGPAHVLTLVLHDIAAPEPGRIAPDRGLMADLLAFGAGWDGARPLVAQCWAGVSRSTAAAFVIACQKRPELAEAKIAAALRHAAPQATPNPLMVALADALLGREGRMVAAVQAIGRGAEFSDFRSAELQLTVRPAGDGSPGPEPPPAPAPRR